MAESGKDARFSADSTTPLEVSTTTLSPDSFSHLGARFSAVLPLGFGSGGLVFSAHDSKTNRDVSIKRLVLSDQRRCRQGLREVKILKRLSHDNIVSLYDVLDASGSQLTSEPSCSVYLIQELMETDLQQVITSRQLTGGHIRLLSYQLLRGLSYLHSANVIHRDLKPANIFVNCDSLLLKIGDFSTSRILDSSFSHAGHLTTHVGTSWYRSPECLLSPASYTSAVDVWAAGCVLAECVLGGPALLPGAHELDQLLQILDAVRLTDQDWDRVLRVTPNKLLKNHPFKPRAPLRRRLAGAESQLLDLIELMLTFDASQRLTAQEALHHPYLDLYSCPCDEPDAQSPFRIEHEVDDLPIEVLQRLFFHECSLSTKPTTDQATERDHMTNPEQAEETHTLEQIFQVPSSRSTNDVDTAATSPKDLASRFTKSKNARNRHEVESSIPDAVAYQNQKNAQNSLRRSPQIFEVCATEGSSCADMEVTKKKVDEEDEEKDIADCSPSKIREDLELGIHGAPTKQAVVDDGQEETLIIEIDATENYKEFSKPSPKELSPSDNPSGPNAPEPQPQSKPHKGAIPRQPQPKPKNDREISKEELYKKHLKEETQTFSRKLILDKIESEKETQHDGLTSEELDELYKLPTDHLAINRDLSNQRLKQRGMIAQKQHQRRFNQYHNQDHRRRIKEDKLYHAEGACGGYDHSPEHSPDHSESEEIIQSILSDSVSANNMVQSHSNAQPVYDIDISLDVLPSLDDTHTVTVTPRDPLSSPESPPSPNSARLGARPKKSPKKQRAT